MFSASAHSTPQHLTMVNAWFWLVLDYLSLNFSDLLLNTYLIVVSHVRTFVDFSRSETYHLSKADEIAPRAYIREMFCFEFDGGPERCEEAVKSVHRAMQELFGKWPHLAGTISQDKETPEKGRILLHQKPEDMLSRFLEGPTVKHLSKKDLGSTFEELRAAGFPLDTAANGRILSSHPPLPEGSEPAPVLAVQLNFVEGGLILSVYLHHSVGDGNCMGTLIESLAKCTRNEHLDHIPESQGLRSKEFEDSILRGFEDMTWEQLLADCPEYKLLPTPSGPFQPDLSLLKNDPLDPATGRIMSFPASQLGQLKDLANQYLQHKHGNDVFVSTNDCMCALLWAHTINVRSKHFEQLQKPNAQAFLTVPVDYRSNIRPQLPSNYFGNAVALARTQCSVSKLKEASLAHYDDPCSVGPLADVALAFRQSIREVDDLYVRKRLALARKIPDIRRLGLSANVELDVTYNTWAPFGGDTVWNIPGTVRHVPSAPSSASTSSSEGSSSTESTLPGVKAEAVRRGHYEFNLVGHLTLPKRKHATSWEVIVQLRQSQMADVLADERFMCWVDRVVD